MGRLPLGLQDHQLAGPVRVQARPRSRATKTVHVVPCGVWNVECGMWNVVDCTFFMGLEMVGFEP